ncbi:hypothetical protein AB0383_19545 [Amycolatopsis sp. NPDC051373]|uniref:hypothetical protein n=1 Tax=Amycolatopsis sp. NPDC051373 TaxID=3155801 RepID=UPI00344C8C38
MTESVAVADVMPISVPSRAELWRRTQLAKSLLGHRTPTPELARLLLAVLNGDAPEGPRP